MAVSYFFKSSEGVEVVRLILILTSPFKLKDD